MVWQLLVEPGTQIVTLAYRILGMMPSTCTIAVGPPSTVAASVLTIGVVVDVEALLLPLCSFSDFWTKG